MRGDLSFKDQIDARISNKTAKIVVFGLGHIGLPLATAIARAGFKVIGVDILKEKVRQVNHGLCSISSDSSLGIQLQRMARLNRLKATTNGVRATKNADFIMLCVPTPLNEKNEPDLKYIMSASKTVRDGLTPGKFIVVESTVYPGTTEGVVKPILEESALKAGIDFGLAFSPERINPGDEKWQIENIPKIVGGINQASTDVAVHLYQSIVKADVIGVSNCRTAEAVKMLENTFRAVNIALVNELAPVFQKMGIDTFEVINAAKTKPFAFMPHYPSTGVGGDCIAVTPFYMSYKAETLGVPVLLTKSAAKINKDRPLRIVDMVSEALRSVGKEVKNSKVLILGLAYKADISDVRNSPSLTIIRKLANSGAHVLVYDPHVPAVRIDKKTYFCEKDLYDALIGSDAVVLATDHSAFNPAILMQKTKESVHPPVIVDGRGFFDPKECNRQDINYYCIGRPPSTAFMRDE